MMLPKMFKAAMLGTALLGTFGVFAAGQSAPAHAADQPPTDQQFEFPVESAEKETVLLTEHGIEPAVISLKKLDASIFFVNTTKDSLASIEVGFGDRRVHCASENMKYEKGLLRSIKPVGPRDFAIMCFPDKGTYPVTVRGIDGSTKPFTAQVTVE